MDGGVEDMRMTRGSEAGNERGRCEGDAGATLALMAILMAILVGMVVIFGAPRFYTQRFVFPAVTAVLVFIAVFFVIARALYKEYWRDVH